MQRVEDFLKDYFRARSEWDRASGRVYEPLEARFLDPGYASFSHEESARLSDEESILSCDVSDCDAKVITSGCFGKGHRMRYLLSGVTGDWRIVGIALECGLCHGSGQRKDGKSECPLCKGEGWKPLGKARE